MTPSPGRDGRRSCACSQRTGAGAPRPATFGSRVESKVTSWTWSGPADRLATAALGRTIGAIDTAPASRTCPVCGHAATATATRDPLAVLAGHLVDEAARSDVEHVMWLNRNVTKRRVDADELAGLLAAWFAGAASGEDRVRR